MKTRPKFRTRSGGSQTASGKPPHRPTLFTPMTRAKLMEGIKLGLLTELTVAEYAGITYRTLRNWLSKGEQMQEGEEGTDPHSLPESEQDFFHFFHDYRQARAQAEAVSIATIRRAGDKDWRAHAWYLERRRPDVYALKHRIEHTGTDGGPIALQGITDVDRVRRIQRLRARLLAQRAASK